ncbi:MAG: hypothetical protein KDD34_03750, partial [Bdellovibrionales bacterium]|nr:hypothetical protein [Bdellovibrionales bacterium]
MNFLKYIFRRLLSIFLLGCDGPLGASENRITIFTNCMAIWGFCSFFPFVNLLNSANVPAKLYI